MCEGVSRHRRLAPGYCQCKGQGWNVSRPAVADAKGRASALLNYEGQAGLDGGTREVAGEAASLGEG